MLIGVLPFGALLIMFFHNVFVSFPAAFVPLIAAFAGLPIDDKLFVPAFEPNIPVFVAICPITSNRTKDWEEVDKELRSPKWQKVITHLSKTCTVITLHHTPLKYKNCINFGHLTITELGYIISKLDLVIGCEAGLTHFAGILGVPMMVLVGSSSSLVLRHYKKVRVLHKGSCES